MTLLLSMTFETMKLLLLPIILISAVALATPADTHPDKHKICEYLAIELQLGVENGYLTQDEATDVINRCYS